MSTVTYPLQGLHCKACVGRVTRKLEPLAGQVEVSLQPMQVVLTDAHADFTALQAAVAGAGSYTLLPGAPAAAAPSTPADNPTAASTAWDAVDDTAAQSWFATYRPLLLIVGYILGASLLAQVAHGGVAAMGAEETMRYFMAGFFLVFSFFKLLDVNAFADAYAGYDLLARRWRGWGLIYPYVELALGIAYLAHFNPVLTHVVTVAVMGFSAIGVIQAVTSKRQIQCACLGAVFKLPMSTVTIVEDLGMVAMALAMLAIAS
ncbi:MAG: heavy-metal-associated domain-containing protein [Comamonadaceae bacterium]|nr:MAG: heavy-metal-associated domain-containing protein [Comamonadaceae bacterium]